MINLEVNLLYVPDELKLFLDGDMVGLIKEVHTHSTADGSAISIVFHNCAHLCPDDGAAHRACAAKLKAAGVNISYDV